MEFPLSLNDVWVPSCLQPGPLQNKGIFSSFAALFTKKSVREQKPKLTTEIKKSRPEFNISNLSSVVNAKYFIFDMMLASVFKELTGTKKIFFW